MKKSLLITLLLACACAGPGAKEYYEKHVAFPADATPEQKVEMASRLVPTPQQLEWQKMELTAFLHFGVNAFTDREWGDGEEDPAIFNPTELDCEQWVKALKEGGFKMAILTAKHHDGFCLWPTRTTTHSVASSPWKDGKGDVVKELKEACDKYGLKFGVYLSPWDRHAECYGQGDAYNQYFITQLTELLTNYGEVHEVWFDGANGEGPNGKKQEYDWAAVERTIRRLQPKAVTAIMGDDVRWVGNEMGIGRKTEWSATVLTPGMYTRSGAQNQKLGIDGMSRNIGSRDMLAKATEAFWYPSEVDVSIRPGWFHHESENDQVKSLAHLVDIYFKSVGYNSVLLLNIPPDSRGLIHENDCARLKEFASYLKTTFEKDYLLEGGKPWSGTTMEYEVEPGATVNTFLIQEDITKGQRVEDFLLEGLVNGEWQTLAEATTIGYKRLVRFAPCQPEKLRVSILQSRAEANILNCGLFYAEPLADEETRATLGNVDAAGWVSNAPAAVDNDIQTVWRAEGLEPLTVDMGKEYQVTGFSYTPSPDDNLAGTIFKYRFELSPDGKNWIICSMPGEFSNIMYNPMTTYVRMEQACRARYFRLTPLAEINGKSCTAIAEVGIFAR